jgi:hypothetical protein
MRVCLTTVLLASLTASCGVNPSSAPDRVTAPEKGFASRRPACGEETAQRQWALGCAAVLTERNHDDHTLLSGCDLTDRSRAEKRVILADSWGIHNRADLLVTLASLQAEGHRADFEAVGKLMAGLDQDTYEKLLAAEDDPEAISKMEIARAYYPLLGAKSLYGWDYSRAICLCRWAYVAGYISEQEAWDTIMPLARVLQQTFDSWEDLGRNYLIGRKFWSHEQTTKNGWLCEDAVQRLLDMRDSPWNQHPWDLDLSESDEFAPIPPRHQAEAIMASA